MAPWLDDGCRATFMVHTLDVDSHELVPVEFWAEVFDFDEGVIARLLDARPSVIYRPR